MRLHFVQVDGMFHLNPSDFPTASSLLPALGLTGPIAAERGYDIVNSYSLAFFDH